MAIKKEMLHQIREFIDDQNIDIDWFTAHITVNFDPSLMTITIAIKDMAEDEFNWLMQAN